MIQLTSAARQEIDRLRRRHNQPDAVCRLTLQPSSCAQWSYALSFDSISSEQLADEQHVKHDFGGLQIVIGRGDTQYLENLVIDFTEDLTGGAFRFDNSLATESCRCGYAFSIS